MTGCCGGREQKQVAVSQKVSATARPEEMERKMRGRIGDACVYCGTKLELRLRQCPSCHRGVWLKMSWCPKCNLEYRNA